MRTWTKEFHLSTWDIIVDDRLVGYVDEDNGEEIAQFIVDACNERELSGLHGGLEFVASDCEIVEFVMPFPVCPECGNALKLDKETYLHYEGQVTCSQCRRKMYVEIRAGNLRACVAAVR